MWNYLVNSLNRHLQMSNALVFMEFKRFFHATNQILLNRKSKIIEIRFSKQTCFMYYIKIVYVQFVRLKNYTFVEGYLSTLNKQLKYPSVIHITKQFLRKSYIIDRKMERKLEKCRIIKFVQRNLAMHLWTVLLFFIDLFIRLFNFQYIYTRI